MIRFALFVTLITAVSGAQARADDVTAPTAAATAPVTEPAKAPLVLGDDKVEHFEQDTLLGGGGKIDSGGYGGPMLRFGRVAGRDAVFVGGKGGWIINHQFLIGGAGVGLANQPAAPAWVNDPTNNGLNLEMGYGGFLMEYFIAPKKVVHGTLSALVGGGSVGVREENMGNHMGYCRDRGTDRGGMGCATNNDWYGLQDSFFIFEPEVGLEMNVADFFRVNAGVTYRVITGVNGDIWNVGGTRSLQNKDVRGLSGSLTFKFGSF
jgi:hypothetical protein